MRSEQEMYDIILGIAKSDQRIRGVILNGSRVNPNVKRDPFQDYDIMYLVTDLTPFKTEDIPAWFGNILVMERTDINELYQENHETYVCYLMQFLDGNRIDLTFAEYKNYFGYCFNDRLSKVLLDKDNILPPLPSPDESSHFIKEPSAQLFLECVTEFWWTAPYVAKGLWRGQLLYAQNHMENCLREMLIKMLSWYVGTVHGFTLSVGKRGDRLKEFIEQQWWQELLGTYTGGAEEEIWTALLTAADLFARVSVETAKKLGCPHNEDTACKVTAFLQYTRSLPRDACTLRLLEENVYGT